jgi:hypothetical protein
MIDEIRKSINANLYEKTNSPLYGTLIVSWAIWNWKVIYYVFVVDSKVPYFDRLVIIKGLVSNYTLFLFPIISTILILTVFEFISNYAYWLSIYHKTWRANKKIETEGKQLLTYEQSLKLRNDIRMKEEEYVKLIQEKETEIKTLKDSMALLNNKEKEEVKPTKSNKDIKNKKVDLIYNRFKDEDKLIDFKSVSSAILNQQSLDPNEPNIKEFVTLGLITRGNGIGGGYYQYNLTPSGTELHDMILFE